MSELDIDALTKIGRRSANRLERAKRQAASAPLVKEFIASGHGVAREMMATAEKANREAVVSFERTAAAAEEELAAREAERQAVLAQARSYTAALRQWLEAIS